MADTDADTPLDPSTTAHAQATLRALLARAAPKMGLTAAAVDVLAAHARITLWRRGQSILAADDRRDLAAVVVKGAVRLVCTSPGGHQMTAYLAGPGRLFGVAPSLERPRQALFGAVAHMPSTVALLPPGIVSAVVAGLPPGDALRLLAGSWRLLSVLLHDKCVLLMMPLRVRVLHELEVLARDFGRPCREGICIDVPLRHDDLAALVVATRAKVTHALAELRQLGRVGVVEARLVLRQPPSGTHPFPSRRPIVTAAPMTVFPDFQVPPPIPVAP